MYSWVSYSHFDMSIPNSLEESSFEVRSKRVLCVAYRYTCVVEHSNTMDSFVFACCNEVS